MTWVPEEAYRDDWQYTEGVVDAGFAYGPDRDTTSLPAAPASGVKVRSGNPTQNQIAVAASTFGYKATDKIFTVWSNRLRADPADASSTAIIPTENDRLIVDGTEWVMRWVKTTVYETQFIVYCSRSQSTEY